MICEEMCNCENAAQTNTPDFVKERCVQQLRKLMKGHDLLKKVPDHEKYLLRFLYSTCFDVPAAFQRMKSFYEFLVESPDWFAKDGPLSQKSLIEKNIRILTPLKDRGGRPIFLQRMGNLNPSTMQLTDVICVDDYWLEYTVDEVNVRENGVCIIIDLKKLSWRLMRWCTPYLTSSTFRKVDVLPVKEFKIHVVNSSFVANTIIKVIWPFVSERIKKMVTFHFDGLESLHDFIEPQNLLSEYGGTATLDFQDCYEKLYAKNIEIRESFKTYRMLFHSHVCEEEIMYFDIATIEYLLKTAVAE